VRVERRVLIDPKALLPWRSPVFRHVREHEPAFAGVPSYIHDAIMSAYIKTAMYGLLYKQILRRTMEPWTGRTKESVVGGF
jgi:hypothetical protein